MSIKAINPAISAQKHRNNNEQSQQSFTGSFNPVVTVMDAIEKGGFAASFISQDGIGMVAPRIYEGLNRNRPKDENGKKTGPLNWEFARREGIREVLSGPSAFLIPLGILAILKKTSGTANNVHVSHINVLGQNFASYASQNPEQIRNAEVFKKGYYAQVFENALQNSMPKDFDSKELKQKAQYFADKLVEIENKRGNKDKKGAKKLKENLVEEYMKLRKLHAAPSADATGVTINTGEKTLGSDIKKLMQSLTDYSGDALKKINKFIDKNKNTTLETLAQNGKLSQAIENFNLRRAGTRVAANLGMWAAVVGFYTLIPKLYNIGLKHDPGLKGLVDEQEETSNKQKNVAFTGNLFSKAGAAAMKDNKLSKFLKSFEFDGASMSVSAMLALLFGFTLPARYTNAKSNKERKEILVRDVSSFSAILFGAKALSRAFSTIFAKASGLALNIKPEDHNKGFLHKLKNYVTAGSGINVLSSEKITSKYSNIGDYHEGINGFFKFLEENGGNVKKVLTNIDKTVKEQSEKIVEKFSGKKLKDATLDEIHQAFEKAKGSAELEKIYTVFASKENKFINRAKTLNSAFGFASTLVLVPAFMMWLARYCEKMTKKAIAKEKEEKALAAAQQSIKQTPPPAIIATDKPSMAGFLNKQ